MPLVTRQANQGNIFNQAVEPPDWLNADLWVDSDNSNLAVNRSGTAVQIGVGTLAQGDILHASTTDTLTALPKGTAAQILTMNSGATLPEWATATGIDFLDSHVATGTESTYTFTPATGLNLETDYDQIIVVIDGEATAPFTLNMNINSHASNDGQILRSRSTTVTGVTISGAGDINLIDTDMIGTNFNFGCIVHLSLADTVGGRIRLTSNGGANGLQSVTAQTDDDSVTIITINISTSTSTWKAGSKFSTYGIKRA